MATQKSAPVIVADPIADTQPVEAVAADAVVADVKIDPIAIVPPPIPKHVVAALSRMRATSRPVDDTSAEALATVLDHLDPKGGAK